MIKTGMIEKTLKINDIERKYIVYIPTGAKSSTAGIYVLPPNGQAAAYCAEKSGWKQLADEEKNVVIFLEPFQGKWNLNLDASQPDDLAYISTVTNDYRVPNSYHIHRSKHYMVGYAEGGTMGHVYNISNPSTTLSFPDVIVSFAGFVSIGGSAISDRFLAETGKQQSNDDPGTLKKDVPLPVWIISNDTGNANPAVVDFWKKANRVDDSFTFNGDAAVYTRTVDMPYPVNQDPAACQVWVSDTPGQDTSYDQLLNRKIWSRFFRRFRRWQGDPNGDLRLTINPEETAIIRYTKNIDGYEREWFEYVPKSVRKSPSKEVPLVIAMHGFSGNGKIFLGNTEWHKVAEAGGFIVVYPTALPSDNIVQDNELLPAWNIIPKKGTQDDVNFIMKIIEDEKSRYGIDKSRIYATGHSLGGIMTHLLGMTRPGVFAAIAPCSSIFLSFFRPMLTIADIKRDTLLPMWLFVGEREGGIITPGSDAEFTIDFWKGINKLTSGSKPDTIEKEGRFSTDTYYSGDGKIPVVKYTLIDKFPHAIIPEQPWMIWNNFFSKLSRNRDGSVNYTDV